MPLCRFEAIWAGIFTLSPSMVKFCLEPPGQVQPFGPKVWGIAPGGRTPLYKSYRHEPPSRVGFWGLFGRKTGIVFEGSMGAYERIYRFNSK